MSFGKLAHSYLVNSMCGFTGGSVRSETLETQSFLVFIENGTEIYKGLMLKLTSLNLVPFQFVKIICGNLVCDSRFSVHDCRHILLRSMKKFVSWHIIGSYL